MRPIDDHFLCPDSLLLLGQCPLLRALLEFTLPFSLVARLWAVSWVHTLTQDFNLAESHLRKGALRNPCFGPMVAEASLSTWGSAGSSVSFPVRSEGEAPSGMSCGVCVQG